MPQKPWQKQKKYDNKKCIEYSKKNLEIELEVFYFTDLM